MLLQAVNEIRMVTSILRILSTMIKNLNVIKENGFEYVDMGDGPTIVLLHGLMGGIENFESIIPGLSESGYRVEADLPLFDKPLLKTNINTFKIYLEDFLTYKKLDKVSLLGNSLGGHIALVFAQEHPEMIESLILTGSSGLTKIQWATHSLEEDYNYVEKNGEVF